MSEKEDQDTVCHFLASRNLSAKEINGARQAIEKDLLALVGEDRENHFEVTVALMQSMWKSYDRHFFKNNLIDTLEKTRHRIIFMINNRLRTSAGRCFAGVLNPQTKLFEYKMELAPKVFRDTFKNEEKSVVNNGVVCRNRLQCAMLIFEHELLHALMFMFAPESTRLGHSELFVRMARSLFQHTDIHHNLLGNTGGDPRKTVNCTNGKPASSTGKKRPSKKAQQEPLTIL